MKKLLVSCITACLIAVTPVTALAAEYIGNANSHKFHYESCQWVKKMNNANKVYLATREEAIKKGYVPCKVCDP